MPMPSTPHAPITQLIHRWQAGQAEALEELIPVVYRQLCMIASKHMRNERRDHTYSTGDLVNEAYLKLFSQPGSPVANRVHFFALAGRIMRNILINHAARKKTIKRGGNDFERALVELHNLGEHPKQMLSQLDEAIERLAKRDKSVATIVELRFFCGYKLTEIADILSMSVATVKRKLELARVWLGRYLY